MDFDPVFHVPLGSFLSFSFRQWFVIYWHRVGWVGFFFAAVRGFLSHKPPDPFILLYCVRRQRLVYDLIMLHGIIMNALVGIGEVGIIKEGPT